MMKNKPIFTYLSLALAVTSLALYYFGSGKYEMILAAQIVSFLAWFSAVVDYNKFSGKLQFAVYIFATTIIGVLIDLPHLQVQTPIPVLTMAMLCLSVGQSIRMLLFKDWGYSKYPIVEFLVIVSGIGGYVAGNIYHPSGWQGWAFPGAAVFMGVFHTVGIWAGGKEKQTASKAQYQALVGSSAPDFELPDQNNQNIKLSDFKDKQNVLLLFVRGDWCPGCHIMLRTYEVEKEKFGDKNIFLLAVGPDPVGVNFDMVSRLGIEFKVLSDEHLVATKQYGVQNPLKPPHAKVEGIPLPASFLVDKDGVIRYTSRPDRLGEFLDPKTIFPILEQVAHK